MSAFPLSFDGGRAGLMQMIICDTEIKLSKSHKGWLRFGGNAQTISDKRSYNFLQKTQTAWQNKRQCFIAADLPRHHRQVAKEMVGLAGQCFA
jgi:hypothetical protein